jgi:hypothetical protein
LVRVLEKPIEYFSAGRRVSVGADLFKRRPYRLANVEPFGQQLRREAARWTMQAIARVAERDQQIDSAVTIID